MSKQSFSMNSVKEARTNSGEGLSPGRCSTEQQGGSGGHRTTREGRSRKWQKPEVVGYIERMHMIWKEKGMFDIKEQQVLDQKWQIVTRKVILRFRIE